MTNEEKMFDMLKAVSERLKYVEENSDRLTRNEKKCWRGCDELDKRIHKLEEHHVRQVDENRKVSRRLDELEEKLLIESQWRKFSLMEGIKFKTDIEVKNEENKNGLSFEEALIHLKQGKKIKRTDWDDDIYWSIDKGFYMKEDFLKDDWEIVE